MIYKPSNILADLFHSLFLPRKVEITITSTDQLCYFVLTAVKSPTCNFCFGDAGSGDDVELCNSEQASRPCSNQIFPNVGAPHCYTAAGRYKYPGSQDIHTGIARGCINCTG